MAVEEADVGDVFLMPPGDGAFGVVSGAAGKRSVVCAFAGQIAVAGLALPCECSRRHTRAFFVDPPVLGVVKNDLVGRPPDLRVLETVERQRRRGRTVLGPVALRRA